LCQPQLTSANHPAMVTPSRTVQRLLSDIRRDLHYIRTRLEEMPLPLEHRKDVTDFHTEIDARLQVAQTLWADFMRDIEESPELEGREARKRLGDLIALLTGAMLSMTAKVRKYEVIAEWDTDLLSLSLLLKESAEVISASFKTIRDDLELFSNLIHD
jgi:hypothetical protein